MKTTKKLQRLHLEKNTTRYRKMSGGAQSSTGEKSKSRFPATRKIFGNIGKSIGSIGTGLGKRVGYIKKNTNQPLTNTPNRFLETSKVFRGIGSKFGLYKETPRQRIKGAVDELVKEIGKFNDKTRNYAQYDITDKDAGELKQQITDALNSSSTNASDPHPNDPLSRSAGQAIGQEQLSRSAQVQPTPNPTMTSSQTGTGYLRSAAGAVGRGLGGIVSGTAHQFAGLRA